MKNIKEINPVEGPAGIFRRTLEYTDEAMVCHFTMKKGAIVPLHNHHAAQIGYVISGKIQFNLENGNGFIAENGCSYCFDRFEYHGAEVLEDSEVMETFSPARDEYK
jgi:quercetin dioxygenase-like cupin family protein